MGGHLRPNDSYTDRNGVRRSRTLDRMWYMMAAMMVAHALWQPIKFMTILYIAYKLAKFIIAI